MRDQTQRFLPATGVMTVDADDLAAVTGSLEGIIFHEAFHALGFGALWLTLGLLEDPTVPLLASEDATMSFPVDADRNFGIPIEGIPASSNIVVGANLGIWSSAPADEIMEGLLKFDLSAIPPDFSFSRAVLQLHVNEVEGPFSREVQVAVVLDPWEESTVTGAQVITVESPALLAYDHDICDFCFLDITPAVEDWISGSQTNNGLGFFSLESQLNPDFTVGYHSRHVDDIGLVPILWLQRETGFSGTQAISSFRAIGGQGANVPVENDVRFFGLGSLDFHWRESVFDDELMTPAANGSLALSAVTVASMADLGYEVDMGVAEPFSLSLRPSTRVGGLVLENDIRIAPVVILERDGSRRVVHPSRGPLMLAVPRGR